MSTKLASWSAARPVQRLRRDASGERRLQKSRHLSARTATNAAGGGEEIIGVVLVDHGSRRSASNEQLERFASLYASATGREVVEAAHMELAEPSIAEAFARCVERGASTVVVAPFFLSPGRHVQEDIPALAAEAAEAHPGIKYLVSAPIGLHPLMAEVMDSRLRHCLAHVNEDGPQCDVCEGTAFGCELRRG